MHTNSQNITRNTIYSYKVLLSGEMQYHLPAWRSIFVVSELSRRKSLRVDESGYIHYRDEIRPVFPPPPEANAATDLLWKYMNQLSKNLKEQIGQKGQEKTPDYFPSDFPVNVFSRENWELVKLEPELHETNREFIKAWRAVLRLQLPAFSEVIIGGETLKGGDKLPVEDTSLTVSFGSNRVKDFVMASPVVQMEKRGKEPLKIALELLKYLTSGDLFKNLDLGFSVEKGKLRVGGRRRDLGENLEREVERRNAAWSLEILSDERPLFNEKVIIYYSTLHLLINNQSKCSNWDYERIYHKIISHVETKMKQLFKIEYEENGYKYKFTTFVFPKWKFDSIKKEDGDQKYVQLSIVDDNIDTKEDRNTLAITDTIGNVWENFITLSTYHIENGTIVYSDEDIANIICHELGHVAGLMHLDKTKEELREYFGGTKPIFYEYHEVLDEQKKAEIIKTEDIDVNLMKSRYYVGVIPKLVNSQVKIVQDVLLKGYRIYYEG